MNARERRDAAALRVKQAATPKEAEAIYRAEYLPAALAYIASRRDERRFDVLVMTVGRQPYSVALSLTYSPARLVYFIHTDDSRPSAEEALRLVDWNGEPPRYRQVDKASSVAVYAEVREAIRENPGATITIDFTSGTKAMTAAASTAAGHLRLPQVYIESAMLRDSMFGNEEPHEVEHPLLVLGDPQREEAERAFDAGSFEVAMRLFEELRQVGVPHYSFEARVALCSGYLAWNALRFTEAADRLQAAAAALGSAARANVAHEPLREKRALIASQADRARALAATTGKDARTASDAAACNTLTRYLVAAARRREERDPDLAALLMYRALELALQRRIAVAGFDASNFDPPDPDELLRRYRELAPEDKHVRGWRKELGVAECRAALLALGDPALADLLSPAGTAQFKGLLSTRNQGIYAHGFRTLTSTERRGTYPAFRDLALSYVSAAARADQLDVPTLDPEFDFIRFAG